MITSGQRKEFGLLENLRNHHGEFEGIRNQFINLDCDSDCRDQIILQYFFHSYRIRSWAMMVRKVNIIKTTLTFLDYIRWISTPRIEE